MSVYDLFCFQTHILQYEIVKIRTVINLNHET